MGKALRILAAAIVLMLMLAWLASYSFNSMVDDEISMLKSTAGTGDSLFISESAIQPLPYPVQKWMHRSGVVGKKVPTIVYLTQRGSLRTSADRKWMPAEAEQYFNTATPSFIWKVHARMNFFVCFAGRDKLENGHGNMLIKLFAAIPIVNASGPATDQGSLLRYLGEMCWFPAASIRPYISWKEIDENSAEATITQNGIQCSGIFRFTRDGDIISFEANRYMQQDGNTSLQKWYIPIKEWKTISGVRIPVRGDVIWELPGGDFNYFRWEITGISYQ